MNLIFNLLIMFHHSHFGPHSSSVLLPLSLGQVSFPLQPRPGYCLTLAVIQSLSSTLSLLCNINPCKFKFLASRSASS